MRRNSTRDELGDGLRVLVGILSRVGESLDGADEELLLSYSSDLEGASEERLDRLDVLFLAALDGFLHCAVDGLRLEEPGHLGDGFADAVDANYPGAGAAYRRLAESYWTLKMLEGRVSERYSGIALQQLLRDVVGKVEAAFFTEPTAERAVEELAAAQRSMLADSTAPLDADELLHGNPLLVGNPLG